MILGVIEDLIEKYERYMKMELQKKRRYLKLSKTGEGTVLEKSKAVNRCWSSISFRKRDV